MSTAAGTYSDPQMVLHTVAGYSAAAVTAAQNVAEFIAPFPCKIGGIQANAGTAGSGVGSTTLDVLLNGTSIFAASGDKPVLATGSTGAFASNAPHVRAVQKQDVLTLRVLSIPASTGHARVSLSVALERPR